MKVRQSRLPFVLCFIPVMQFDLARFVANSPVRPSVCECLCGGERWSGWL